MAVGLLEVLLVSAKGLEDSDFLGDMDPYVIIQYKGQERKSSVARGDGSSPKWNEKFTFKVEYPGSGSDYKLVLKIMDKDTFSSDDFVGQAVIYVKDLLSIGAEKGSAELHPTKHSVVNANQSFCGNITVGATFTRQVIQGQSSPDQWSVNAQIQDQYPQDPRPQRSPPRRVYDGDHCGSYDRREPSQRSLLVRNIPFDCRLELLRILFERFGPVRDVYIPKNYYTGEPRGFKFVQFIDSQDAAEARRRMNGIIFDGREISVVVAAETRKRPEEMRNKTGLRGTSGYRGRSSHYGMRSPHQPSGSRGCYISRKHTIEPKEYRDYRCLCCTEAIFD